MSTQRQWDDFFKAVEHKKLADAIDRIPRGFGKTAAKIGGIREHIINFKDMEDEFNPEYVAKLGPAWREDGFKWLKGLMDSMPPPPNNPICMGPHDDMEKDQ